MRRLRRFFLTGVIVTLPAVATIYVLWLVFNFLDQLAGKVVILLLGQRIPGLGLVVTVTVVIVAGFLATNYIGRFLLNLWDELMYRIPLVNSIYRTVKQMVEAIWREDKKAFQKVVMIEYPRHGIFSLGFLTGPAPAEASMRAAADLVNVFIPTTPNPTSGFLLMVPAEDVVPLDMPVEDGIKLIISAGVVGPAGRTAAAGGGIGWSQLLKGLAAEGTVKDAGRRGGRGTVQQAPGGQEFL
ncbi:hypothetical protein MGLY_19000 [Neomoorella glycerini]|uniref:DUF502 domain-containing protein n=1 Tax=Neomoorella glycerini TaxID=55779 RepID=A0A6I5ZRZ5_9FIRM|nr:DUF502 domain-containing protein [Moorella glycerini]QGP92518.1 hypothetical protein MGLY_19000 [Moorella glycerini]